MRVLFFVMICISTPRNQMQIIGSTFLQLQKIAIIGGRWIPTDEPNYTLHQTQASHVEVGKMFFNPTTDNDLNLSHVLLNCIEGSLLPPKSI